MGINYKKAKKKKIVVNDEREYLNWTALKKARKKLKLTLEDIAHETGITIASIAYYEKHARCPKPDFAWSLIDFYEKKGIKLTLYDFYPRSMFLK